MLEELIDSSTLKLVYNEIKKEDMPANLKLELKKPIRTSRDNSPIIIAKDKNKSTFIEEANKYLKTFQAVLSSKYVLCRAIVLKTS